MKYGQLTDPNAPITVEVVETKKEVVEQPPVPKTMDQKDINKALDELTKR